MSSGMVSAQACVMTPRELELGRQIYIVYPLIKETEKMDLKDLEAGFEEISKAFPRYQVSKVHGKMKSGTGR